MENPRSVVLRNVISYSLVLLIVQILSLLKSVFIYRIIYESGLGLIVLLLSIPPLSLFILFPGTQMTIPRNCKNSKKNPLFTRNLIYILFFSIICALIVFSLKNSLISIYEINSTMILFLAIHVIIGGFQGHSNLILISVGDQSTLKIATLLFAMSDIFLEIVFTPLLGVTGNYQAYVLSICITSIFLLLKTLKYYDWDIFSLNSIKLQLLLIKDSLGYGFVNMVTYLSGFLLTTIVIFTHNTTEMGIYSVGMVFARPITILSNSIVPTMFSSLTNISDTEKQNLTSSFLESIAKLFIPLIIAWMAIAPLFYSIFYSGSVFESIIISGIIIMTNFFSIVSYSLNLVLISSYKNKYSIWTEITGKVINVVILILLVTSLGATGLALSNMVCIIIIVFLRILLVKINNKEFFVYLIIFILSGFIVIYLFELISNYSIQVFCIASIAVVIHGIRNRKFLMEISTKNK